MSLTGPVWLLVSLALLAANLPFISNRVMAVYRLRSSKTLVPRRAQMVVWYFVVVGLALFLKQRAGKIASQGWELYAVTGTLLVTFAFPGFVYRYLLKPR